MYMPLICLLKKTQSFNLGSLTKNLFNICIMKYSMSSIWVTRISDPVMNTFDLNHLVYVNFFIQILTVYLGVRFQSRRL